MFEESEWNEDGPDEGAPGLGPASPRLPLPPPPGPGGSSRQRRRHLLATLRRLQQGLGPRGPPSSSSSGGGSASESESEGQLRSRSRRRALDPPGPLAGPQQQQQQQQQQQLLPPRKRTRGRGKGEGAAGDGQPAASSQRRDASIEGAATEGAPRQLLLLTRKQRRNRQKNKRRQKNKFKAGVGPTAGEPLAAPPAEEPPGGQGDLAPSAPVTKEESPSSRAAVLRLRMEERLDAARFRYINQQLYMCPSQEAARLFQGDPEALAIYHRGFARQVARWPESPVQRLVHYLRHRPASLVVADFGCGDCALARSLRNKVHCFDLVALDPRVTVCDMAQVPLEAESVDVAVFCLALMGTNLREILEEASRVLRVGGTLLVAEVASRFSDVRAFVGALSQLGFQLVSKDVSGSHFYTFELRKAAPARGGEKRRPLPALALRPCLYKRR